MHASDLMALVSASGGQAGTLQDGSSYAMVVEIPLIERDDGGTADSGAVFQAVQALGEGNYLESKCRLKKQQNASKLSNTAFSRI